jgi:hypothetical protein
MTSITGCITTEVTLGLCMLLRECKDEVSNAYADRT